MRQNVPLGINFFGKVQTKNLQAGENPPVVVAE
jgi:hypothetical protein